MRILDSRISLDVLYEASPCGQARLASRPRPLVFQYLAFSVCFRSTPPPLSQNLTLDSRHQTVCLDVLV
jgi:hypothetical protein